MATDSRQELDKKTKKLSAGGLIETGKEHAAYQETQQQLLAILAERQQNLAVARAESKASSDNMQTLAQAAELGAVSAAEAEQAAMAGGEQTVNPATLAVLNKYGMGKPRIQRAQSHNQQVTKQNITINNNTTVTTKNDVNVPANIGGPLQGRPVQFRPQAKAADSTGKFKAWISSAFARQNEEGARRDREYRHRESSLTKSASRMMKKLEEIGKTIGTRMDPRKIGSTWTSQLKTLLFLFGFGYLANNWVKILGWIEKIADWIKGTWNFFTGGSSGKDTPFISTIKSLFGARNSESFAEIFRNLLIGDENNGEKGLFGHLKLYFKDIFDERAKAVKLVKFPTVEEGELLNNPLKLVEKLFGYIGNLLTAMVSGIDGVKEARISEIGEKVTKSADENRIKNSTTDLTQKRTVNGEKVNVELGTLAFKNSIGQKEYKGLSHHTLEGNELTDKFGAESSVSQMSEVNRLITKAKTTGEYDTDSMAISMSRLSRFAGRKGFIPVNRHDLRDILTSEDLKSLEDKGYLRKNVTYKEVIRKKTDDDYNRNKLGNNYLNPELASGAAAAINTLGADAASKYGLGHIWSATYKVKNGGGLKSLLGDYGSGMFTADVMKKTRDLIRDGQSNYRTEFIREDAPLRRGVFATGKTELFDEISKEGIKEISKMILARNNKNFDENLDVNPEDVTKYSNLIKLNALAQFEGHREERLKQIDNELKMISSSLFPTPTKPNKYNLDFKPIENNPLFNGLDKATLERTRKLIYERNQLTNKRFGKYSISAHAPKNPIGLEEGLSDVAEVEAWVAERDAQREADWENSAPGRAVNAWKDKVFDPISNEVSQVATSLGFNKKQAVSSKLLDQRAMYTIKRLMNEGLTREQAAGIAGNIMKESGFDPKAGGTDNNNQYSGGIVLWNGPAYKAAKDYFGKDLKFVNYENQLEYLIKELKGEAGVIRAINRNGFASRKGYKTGSNVMDIMKKTTSVADSTNTFERVFEGSGDFEGYWDERGGKRVRVLGDGNAKRLNFAASFYQKSGGTDLSNISYVNSQSQDGSDGVVIPGSINYKWVSCVNEVTEWYNKNIHTYHGNSGDRQYYKSPWGDISDDCSGLVSACLTAYLGSHINTDSVGLGDKNTELGKKLEGGGFGYIRFTSWGALLPYDIIVAPGSHTEIYAGKVNGIESAFSWGSVHDQKRNPTGPPWPANTKRDYKVIWRNGSGSGPDFMYKNNIAGEEDKNGETSFLSILFNSVTKTLKDFASGMASSDNSLVSSIGDFMGKAVEKAEELVGKTEDVEKAIKEKEVPKLQIPDTPAAKDNKSVNVTTNNTINTENSPKIETDTTTETNPTSIINNSTNIENFPRIESTNTTETTSINKVTDNLETSKIPSLNLAKVESEKASIQEEKILYSPNDITDSNYEIIRKAALESSTTGDIDSIDHIDVNLFEDILKNKYGFRFGGMNDITSWASNLSNQEWDLFNNKVFKGTPKSESTNLISSKELAKDDNKSNEGQIDTSKFENLTDSDFEVFRKAAIESSSTGDFDHVDYNMFDKLLKEKYNVKFPYDMSFTDWYGGQYDHEQDKFMLKVFKSMPKKGSINLDELSDTDYSNLKQLSEKYKDESGNLDIEGFTADLKKNYDIDLGEWYKSGSKEVKDKLVNQIFGSTPKEKIVSPEKIEVSTEGYTSFNDVVPEYKNPLIHYTSAEVPEIFSIENSSMDNEFSYLSKARKQMSKDDTLTTEITKAVSESGSSNGKISAKLSAIANIIGGGVDSINSNNTQLAQLIAGASRSTNKNTGITMSPNYLSKTNDTGVGNNII